MSQELTQFIKTTALKIGFDACGIAKATRLDEDAERLKKWIKEGNHGEMSYMERNFEKRVDPRVLVEGCKSVIVVLMNYFPQQPTQQSNKKIAKYAISGVDYHYVLKQKLKVLEEKIVESFGEACFNNETQHNFVDSAPILERRWAERAGLGWIGKNKMLINPKIGSYFFIGVLLINKELEYDTPLESRCGNCTRCIDGCPTNALSIENGLDAKKCISYQTIEKKGEIDTKVQKKLSGYIFGCDICQDVCPWNRRKPKPNKHKEFAINDSLSLLTNGNLDDISNGEFKRKFKNTAFARAGLKKLKQTISYIDETNKEE